MEQGLGRTLASPLSEMGSMEGSEQRGGTPDLGDYRHRLETAGATVGGGVGGGLSGPRKLGAVMVPRVGSEDQRCGSV